MPNKTKLVPPREPKAFGRYCALRRMLKSPKSERQRRALAAQLEALMVRVEVDDPPTAQPVDPPAPGFGGRPRPRRVLRP